MVTVGLLPHTGWTWLVRVEDRRVVSRSRVVALEVEDAQLYHLASEHRGDRSRFFASQRAAVLALAIDAIRSGVAGAKTAVVLGKRQVLPPLADILASHPLIHTAEGDLWRALFAEACEACGVIAVRAEPIRATADASWLAAEGKRVGAPWNAEVKDAAVAAREATRIRR